MHMRLVCLRGLAKVSVTIMSGPRSLRRRGGRGLPRRREVTKSDGIRVHADPDSYLTGMFRYHPSRGFRRGCWINRTMQSYNRPQGLILRNWGKIFSGCATSSTLWLCLGGWTPRTPLSWLYRGV